MSASVTTAQTITTANRAWIVMRTVASTLLSSFTKKSVAAGVWEALRASVDSGPGAPEPALHATGTEVGLVGDERG